MVYGDPKSYTLRSSGCGPQGLEFGGPGVLASSLRGMRFREGFACHKSYRV